MAPLLCSHSTHVTGTICAKGFVPRARGFAYEAKANTYLLMMSQMSSFGANGFSVKPFLWLWYNRFFSNGKIWLL
jgi:hypothetical protein